jgi:hypothetical protein
VQGRTLTPTSAVSDPKDLPLRLIPLTAIKAK